MNKKITYWQALNRALDAEMAADDAVFILGEDVGLYGGSYRVTEGLYAKYGDWRVRDTPISEGGFTGLGVGAALVGIDAPAPPMHRAAIRRKGDDLTIVSYSRTAILVEQAARQLADKGISVEVIDLRSLHPIDWDTCAASVEKTHHLLVVEEDCRFAGAGAEIAARLGEQCFYVLDAPVQRHAGLDIPTPYNATLEAASIPTPTSIANAALELLDATYNGETS
jgi:pyruvate/2-oxoglutarate/acetoin dehydrogenase E1 component